MKESKSNAWGKLTSTNINFENISLTGNPFLIGRHSECQAVIENLAISSNHCRLYAAADNKYFLEDLSTNGTFIEDKKIGKGNKHQIFSGDKIYLIPSSKVRDKSQIIGYVFSAQNDFSRIKEEDLEIKNSLLEMKKSTEKQLKFQEHLGEEMLCQICYKIMENCISALPCLHSFCEKCVTKSFEKSKECPKCKEKIIELKKNALLNNLIEKFLETNPGVRTNILRPNKENNGFKKTEEEIDSDYSYEG